MCTWKRWEKAAALALLLTLLISAWECCAGLRTQNAMAEKVVRLHVLANSDSQYDQNRKLLVKDAVFVRTEEILRSAADQKDAERLLEANLPSLERLAEEKLRESGNAERVSINLVSERFNTRYYDGFTLPAGEYRSLQVVIGDGKGQNWWCVVFPPLCSAGSTELAAAAEQAGFSDEEIRLIREGEKSYEIRFRTLELWNQLMQFFA